MSTVKILTEYAKKRQVKHKKVRLFGLFYIINQIVIVAYIIK